MTNYEKNIYNTYLRVTRTEQDKPFKYRKNFSNFEDTKNYIYIKKLSTFFKNYKHVDPELFFKAPFNIYPDAKNYNLNFYITQKAIKAYTLYRQKQQNADPDSEQQLEFTTESIYYIYKFCKDTDIPLTSYTAHKTGSMNSFLLHLKEHKINVYSLFGLPNFEIAMAKNDTDVVDFMLPNMYQKISTFRTKYYNSEKMKSLVSDGFSLVKTTLSS